MKIDSVKVKSPAIATEFYSRILVVLQFFIEDCISVIENQRPSCISAGDQRRPCKVPCRINRRSPRKLLLYWYVSLAENRTIKSLTQPLYYLKKGSIFSENGGFFFIIWVFFNKHSWITGEQGKGEGISLTPRYHFYSFHRHLDISWVITAESSPLHIGCSQTQTGNLWFPSRSY